jgi:molybdate transport system regulatory protein
MLGLRVGGEALALVKASWVIVALESGEEARDSLQLSARNRLPGSVVRLTPGAVNTEVVIGLQGYAQHAQAIAAIITSESARSMGLKEGTVVSAVFKASSVILGIGR